MDRETVDELERVSREITRQETCGSWALWFGVLGSPLAWAGHLVANYSLEEWFACAPSTSTPGEILGVGVHTMAVVINSAMAAVALISGVVALRCWQRLRGSSGHDEAGTARWMAFAGVVEGFLFLGIILLGYLPAFTLGTCETTP